jgi:hypothetical protein
MRKVVMLAATCLLPTCARPDYADAWPDHFALSAGAQPGYAIKQVVEKQGPVTLVADDGSVCRTLRERLAATKEGKWIACLWALPSFDSTELSGLNR